MKLGMVVETSEFTSEDESSDEDDKVKHGDVRVAWYPAGTEQVIPEKRLHLADRLLYCRKLCFFLSICLQCDANYKSLLARKSQIFLLSRIIFRTKKKPHRNCPTLPYIIKTRFLINLNKPVDIRNR